MRLTRAIHVVAAAAALATVLGLAACGRKGGLDLPPSAAPGQPVAVVPAAASTPPTNGFPGSAAPQNSATKAGFDAQGNPMASPGQKKQFLLDPLLQ